jgi:patatin-like phospholipase/acyl hydrolase
MAPFTILSIDGGGIRGIIPAMILTEIERRTGHRIAEMFDLIAGTSTGGILALGLTVPQSPNARKPKYRAKQLVAFYEEDGKQIFHSFWHNVVSLHGLIDEKYPSEQFERVLQKYLGEETKLSQALTDVLITSYEIETCRPFFFTRRKARARRAGRFNPRMWEVARCTSAAPTYFSPHRITRPRSSRLPPLTFVDAGVFVNNPTLCAYAEAVSMQNQPKDGTADEAHPGGSKQAERPVEVRSREVPTADEADYVVLSLGTGELNTQIRYEDARRWGTLHWARPLIDIAYDGSSDTVDGQMRQLMPIVKRPFVYYRFQASLSEANNALDDTSDWNIQDLKRRAESIFEDPEKLEKIENLCKLLRQRFDATKSSRGNEAAASKAPAQ